MGKVFDFITEKEVVISPWQKKPDVQLVDPSGEVLTILLDITLPALFQKSAGNRDDVYKRARKAKTKDQSHFFSFVSEILVFSFYVLVVFCL